MWVTVFETIGVFGVDGERQALLTMPPGWRPAGDHDPVWLPDGKSLVGCVWGPIWSPTGDRIAFTTWKRETGGVNELRVLDVATGTVTLLAEAGGSHQLQAIDFSPKGERILFARTEGGRIGVGSLWSVNADGSDAPVVSLP